MSQFEVIGLDSSVLDISSRVSIKNALQKYEPGFVINAAAYTAVDKAESDPGKAEQVNAIGAGYLAELTAGKNIPLIHISTDYVFDGKKDGSYLEEDATSPLGVYGRTKLQGEMLVMQFQPRVIILRTSWVFGVEGNNFPKTMIRLARERQELGVVADQAGCPTFADDIAKTIFGIIARYQASPGKFPWGLYHYASAHGCSWYEFACLILEIAHQRGVIAAIPTMKKLTTAQYPTPARRPQNSVLGCHKFCRIFPEMPLSDVESGINALLQGWH
jgi:dTDP-4-dehydrorhamnose reductase